jgi:hypothetical protein
MGVSGGERARHRWLVPNPVRMGGVTDNNSGRIQLGKLLEDGVTEVILFSGEENRA